jgi:hypothetical protein
MDCCARANHDCPDQQAADACCAQGEHGQQEQLPAGPILVAPPSLAMIAVLAPTSLDSQVIAARAFQQTRDTRPHRPPYLLASVLLI